VADHRSPGGEDQEPGARLPPWIIEHWPHIIIWTGLLLFWLACIDSAHLPLEAVLVGPVLMLAGVIMLSNKRHTQ
jgi:hypothetical protein